jgi:hypothetical protein
VFNAQKQGCFDRYTQSVCTGSSNYYKPSMKKVPSQAMIPTNQIGQQTTSIGDFFYPFNNMNNNHNYS